MDAREMNLEAIERQAREGTLPVLIAELASSTDATARLLARALRLDLTVLAAYPELAYPCLYRRAAWSGAEAAAFFAARSDPAPAAPLRPLLDAWLPQPGRPWLRALRPPPVGLDGALREEYRGNLPDGAPVFARDGTAVGVRGADGGAVAWDRRSGARLSRAELDARLPAAAPARFALARSDEWGRCDLIDTASGRHCQVRVDQDATFDCVVDAPDGHAVAGGWFRDYDGVIVRLDPRTARVVWRTDLNRWIQSLVLSADGALLLAGDGGGHHLVDAGSGRVIGWLSVPGRVQFSPDGREMALGRGDALQVWDLGAIRRGDNPPLAPGPGLIDAAFSPDGARLLTGDLLCDGVTGRPVARLSVDSGNYLEGGPPRDGRRLTDRLFIEVAPLGGFRAWDAATGEPVLQDEDRRHSHADLVAISPLGDRYAATRRRSALEIRSVVDGAQLGRIDLPVAGAVFSSDGSRIAVSTEEGELWIASSGGGDLSRVGAHPCRIHDLALAHDGVLLASRDAERRVRVWHPQRGLVAERQDADWRPLADSVHGWSGYRAHDHPLRARTAAGLAEIVDERSGHVIARLPADEDLVPDATGRRWASRGSHIALEGPLP